MNVELTPQQEAELAKLAESKGRNVGQLAQDVIDCYLQHEARFIEAINRGLQSLKAQVVEIVRIFHAAQDWP